MFKLTSKKLVLLVSHLIVLAFLVHETNYKQPDSSTPTVAGTQDQLVHISKVIDGDTIELDSGEKVRLIGINTPETVDPRRAVQCFGKEASDETKKLLENKDVRLEKDISETDKYGRLLRYVYKDNVLINEVLVKEGFAYADRFPPDVKFADMFSEAQTYAREHNLGLWNKCPVKKTS